MSDLGAPVWSLSFSGKREKDPHREADLSGSHRLQVAQPLLSGKPGLSTAPATTPGLPIASMVTVVALVPTKAVGGGDKSLGDMSGLSCKGGQKEKRGKEDLPNLPHKRRIGIFKYLKAKTIF